MEKWNEMIQESFIKGTKLPKEIVAINENHEAIRRALDALRLAEDNIWRFKNILSCVYRDYNEAKNTLNITELRNLDATAKLRNEIIDSNFELTLNWLSAKEEGETDEQIKERVTDMFKLPYKKYIWNY